MKTIQLIQLVLSMLVLIVSVQDTHAVMKRVRAAPKSRSDAEKRRLRYKTEEERRHLSHSSSSDEGMLCLCVLFVVVFWMWCGLLCFAVSS